MAECFLVARLVRAGYGSESDETRGKRVWKDHSARQLSAFRRSVPGQTDADHAPFRTMTP